MFWNLFGKPKPTSSVMLKLIDEWKQVPVTWHGGIHAFATPYLPHTRTRLFPKGEVDGPSYVKSWLPCSPDMVQFFDFEEPEHDTESNVMDSWLCESKSHVLRIGQLYRFRPDPKCKTCMRMKREHDKAYDL